MTRAAAGGQRPAPVAIRWSPYALSVKFLDTQHSGTTVTVVGARDDALAIRAVL
jgi:hypothetical protein